MSRINTKNATPRKGSGIVKTVNESIRTHEGAAGFKRDAKSELFLTAVSSFNENTFYESANERRDRISELVQNVAEDGVWLENLVIWLRQEAGMRVVPVMIAAEAVHARLKQGVTGGNREIVRASIGRLDESAEFLAYWISRFGRTVPSAVKRGISDALNEKLNETSFLKWRGRANKGAVSLRDTLNITRAKPKDGHQSALYKAVIDHAYGHNVDTTELPIVRARNEFLKLSTTQKISELTGPNADEVINKARLTHEVIAGAIGNIPASIWENLIPNMGYTALRMNLRRISEAGVSDKTVDAINAILRSKENVAKSKTMPIGFLSAYRNAPLDFAGALQKGANGALENVPSLPGRTLVLLDRSGSMGAKLSERSSLTYSDAANVFAAAIAIRGENVDVVSFDNEVKFEKITSKDLLKVAQDLPGPRGGTSTAAAVKAGYKNHDRVIVLTDEQYGYGYYSRTVEDVFKNVVPENVPSFTWNLVGYQAAHAASGPARFTFGGLTDKGFQMIPLIEKGFNTGWPWEN